MKKLLCLLLCAAMLLALVACGAKPEQAPNASTSDTPAADAPEKEVRTDLTMITQVTPDSLDPQGTTMLYAYQVLDNIYDRLVGRDANGNVIPGLAESYSANEEGSAFTFKLREGVKFHNGEELTADDVVFTVERGKSLNLSNYALIEAVNVLSDYEVELVLTQGYAPFLGILTTSEFSILNREATEAGGETYGRSPVGAGPYKFVEWAEGEYIKLEAFEEYWDGAPSIKDVTIKFIGDTNTALIAMEAGDADYSYVVPNTNREDIEANEDLKLVDYNSNVLQFLTLNTQNTYLSNKLVRQAINYAINRDDVVTVAVEGLGVPTTQYCNPDTFGYLEGSEGYTHDVEKAKTLMSEAGYADGFTVKVIAQDEMTSKMAQVFADNLREINITCEIELQESNTAVSNFIAGNYEIGVLGMGNPTLDFIKMASLFKGNLLLCQATDGQAEEITALFNEAVTHGDDASRLGAYAGVAEEIWDASYYVPVFFPIRSHLLAADLEIDCIRGTGIALIKEMHWD